MGIFLVLLATVLFILSLLLTLRPARVPPARKIIVKSKGRGSGDHQTIQIKLPREGSIPDDYVLDVRLSLSRAGNTAAGRLEGGSGRKGSLHHLDDYF